MAIRTNIINYLKCKKIKYSNQKTQAEWIQKQDPYTCCLQETHFRSRETYRLKVRGWKKVFPCKQKSKCGAAIFMSDKIKFKIKTVTREKEGH